MVRPSLPYCKTHAETAHCNAMFTCSQRKSLEVFLAAPKQLAMLLGMMLVTQPQEDLLRLALMSNAPAADILGSRDLCVDLSMPGTTSNEFFNATKTRSQVCRGPHKSGLI